MIGFTGTQNGMTLQQKEKLRELLSIERLSHNEFHHGDCIGSDEQACLIAVEAGFKLFCHPPNNPSKRAFVKSDFFFAEKSYLERNHDIVDSCNKLYAAPEGFEEELRSGTWSTIRYAKQNKKQVIIIYPNGKIDPFLK
jgi:hypothetical protein